MFFRVLWSAADSRSDPVSPFDYTTTRDVARSYTREHIFSGTTNKPQEYSKYVVINVISSIHVNLIYDEYIYFQSTRLT